MIKSIHRFLKNLPNISEKYIQKKNIFFAIASYAIVIAIQFSCTKNNIEDSFSLQHDISICDKPDPTEKIYKNSLETNSEFFINDNKLIFVKNIEGKYQLISHNLQTNQSLFISEKNINVERPFLYNNKISYLTEYKGSSKFIFKDSIFVNSSEIKYVDQLFFSDKGEYLLVKYKDNNILYLTDCKKNSTKEIFNTVSQIKGVSFNIFENLIVLCIDDSIIMYDISNNIVSRIFTNKGENSNPFVIKDYVYFSSNSESDNYNIYKLSLEDKKVSSVISSNKDLRQPKVFQNKIFYIEIDKSNYLLKYKNLDDLSKTFTVNEIGVVYSYEVKNGKVFFSYSDLKTPRCIKMFDLVKKKLESINCQEQNEFLSANYIFPSNDLSPAYVFNPISKKRPKGVILYFRAGRKNDDLSPRWDNMLMPLVRNGYIVIAPNFPSSVGYGKSYARKSLDEAALVMNRWKLYIKSKYNIPLFFFGISSGSSLMEKTINLNHDQIKAVVSSFGFQNEKYQEILLPTMYILGEKDPLIDFKQRKEDIRYLIEKSTSPAVVISFKDESHWIRHPDNFECMYKKMFKFLDYNFN